MINIYGKGGHAYVIKKALESNPSKYFKVYMFNDDDYDSSPLMHDIINMDPWIIGIGNNKDRKKISKKLKGKKFTTVIHHSAICDIDPGEGSQIMMGSVVQVGTKIGKHCIINTAASVDHDCILEDFTFIGPNATLCGGVEIGEGTFIGAGAVVLPYIKIGKNCMIGAGAVVTKDIPSDSLAYGNPAKIK